MIHTTVELWLWHLHRLCVAMSYTSVGDPDFSWVFGLLHHCQVFSLKLKDVLQ